MSKTCPAQMPGNDDMPVDPRAEFRQLMGQYATGVCIVALEYGNVDIAAMTVNSLVSVSLNPRLISWSVQNSATQFDLFARAERFSISILTEAQEKIARRYAARGGVLMDKADFVKTASGAPVVSGALGHLECRKWSEFEAGDHTMLFGEVQAMSKANRTGDVIRPLGFFNGQYCAIEP